MKAIIIIIVVLWIIVIGGIIYFVNKNGEDEPPTRPPEPTPRPPTRPPEPTPRPPISSSGTFPMGTKGNGKASTSYYTGVDSPGQGSCGGCTPMNELGLEMFKVKRAGNQTVLGWTMTAPSVMMQKPYCGNYNAQVQHTCALGTAKPENPATAQAPCGSSFLLTNRENGKKIAVVVADTCGAIKGDPSNMEHDQKWCHLRDGHSLSSQCGKGNFSKGNCAGEYNHFDIWHSVNSSGYDVMSPFGLDNPYVTFEPIPTPQIIQDLMSGKKQVPNKYNVKSGCCGIYWTNQGCPTICGDSYKCPNSD